MRRALRIAFLGQGWAPDTGGVEAHCEDLARALGARGHALFALVLDAEAGREAWSVRATRVGALQLSRAAYAYADQRVLGDLADAPLGTACVLRWLAAVRPDVLHVHHLTGFGLGVLPAVRAAGVPVLVTLHDYWSLCPRGQMLRSGAREPCAAPEPALCGACIAATWPHLCAGSTGDVDAAAAVRTRFALAALAAADVLVAPSAALRAVFERAGVPRGRIRVVENGIEAESLAAAATRARTAAAPRARPRLGVLGSLLPAKGGPFLARVVAAAPDLELELAFHGPPQPCHGERAHLAELEDLAQRDPRIVLCGAYSRAELPRLLAQLDGVAAPALWEEAYGLGVREAAAAGLPLLVSDRGALPAALGAGAGLVLRAGDEKAWAAALARFVDPRERARWAAAALLPRGTTRMTDELEALYGALAARQAESSLGASPSQV